MKPQQAAAAALHIFKHKPVALNIFKHEGAALKKIM